MVGVKDERMKGVPVILGEATKLIPHDDVEAQSTCILEVEDRSVVKMDTLDFFCASYSIGAKLIYIIFMAGVLNSPR